MSDTIPCQCRTRKESCRTIHVMNTINCKIQQYNTVINVLDRQKYCPLSMIREQHKASTNVHIQHHFVYVLYKDLKCKTAQFEHNQSTALLSVYMLELRSGFGLTFYVFVRRLYDNKQTTVLYIYDTPTRFGLQWPSSGMKLTKERVAANYVTDVQL